MEEGTVTLVDVREPDEFGRGHIRGAWLMPLGLVTSRSVQADSGRDVVLCCRSGNRSEMAVEVLATGDHAEVLHLDGGINAWRDAGFELDGRGGGISIMRQVQIVVGTGVLVSTVLGILVSLWWLLVAGLLGAGLAFAGISGTCGLAMVLKRMPWNRPSRSRVMADSTQGACCA